MADVETLSSQINERLGQFIQRSHVAIDELTLEVTSEHLLKIGLMLRDDPLFDLKMLVDVCGVDYLHYGVSEWETESATSQGFERGVERGIESFHDSSRPRFAVVYHLLSLSQNHRVRLRVFSEDDQHPKVPSVMSIWPSANWYEREAFDLFGIEFTSHPDLRRILTDYGFIGHPFRKDFPLIGNVEARYDAKLRRVIYEPVSIKPRILEPKVIRRDNRYKASE